ncbi:MAG: hypothetical protein BGP12_20060 [Rhodospirillales bacterium 70-18]|nr:MAG: hypothetical protein BGP12_20060 [Rhodospirillales bacterium 70-18]
MGTQIQVQQPMDALVTTWLRFAACLGIVAAAAPQLCHSADVISDKTGLSGNWICLVLLAIATSLPELVTGASAVTLTGSVDIVVGDALGSCVFNLLILAVADFAQRGESMYRRVGLAMCRRPASASC